MITILELEKKIIRKLFHCIGDQSFYWEIYNSALQEMNYNCSGEINYSGEKSAIKYVIENLIKTYPGQQLTIFDVGANIGNYTKELLSFTSEECNITIHCFEPSPETFFTLENELEGKKKVILNNIGLSDHCVTQPLYTDKPGSGMTSLYNRRIDHFGVHLFNQGNAVFTTIDQYCNKNKIDRVHFMKIDVEGHELKVIEGGQNSNIDFIQFEFGGTNIDSRTFFQDFWYLLHDRYKLFRILRNGLYEIREYNEQLEIFSCTNYLAELKKND